VQIRTNILILSNMNCKKWVFCKTQLQKMAILHNTYCKNDYFAEHELQNMPIFAIHVRQNLMLNFFHSK